MVLESNLVNFREEAFFVREFKSSLEIYRKFMVDIVEFVFVFAIVFVQMFLIHFLQVVEIVRAFGIHTFVDDKVFTVFLMHQAVVAMRTSQDGVFGKTIIFGWRKKRLADLA